MAEKALNLQKQIRENAQDLGDFLSDLNKWEKDIKKDDEELKRSAQIEQVRTFLFESSERMPALLTVKTSFSFSFI